MHLNPDPDIISSQLCLSRSLLVFSSRDLVGKWVCWSITIGIKTPSVIFLRLFQAVLYLFVRNVQTGGRAALT